MTISITASSTPATSRLFYDIAGALRWLNYGAELAYDLKGVGARHADVIWQLLVEAVEVIDKTPDQEQRWLTSGTRSGWKSPGLSRADLVDLERIRFLSALKPFDHDVNRLLPQGDDEDRALGVLEWMRWVNAAKSGGKLSRAAIALARGGDNEIVQRIYCPGRKPNRQNVREVKVRTVGFIMTGLRVDLGIVRGEGISFRRS
ncbi:hypothetical protein ABIF64_003815 [Bradyrhizobium japonicum]|uniref:hypothetical protein n=1 Tax=Bradyrhizobium japonicum TaxID=375 RepID=UPI00339567FA